MISLLLFDLPLGLKFLYFFMFFKILCEVDECKCVDFIGFYFYELNYSDKYQYFILMHIFSLK